MCLCNNVCMGSRGKIRIYFLFELLVWLLVIIVGVSVIGYHKIKEQQELKSYQVFLQDVDGLIVGSPVRMMGVPIGYITVIKVVQDHIYVKFVITEKSFSLPKGIIATVEFNGMGGSKSLELYPPDEVSKASGNLIAIKPTNRLGAAIGLLDDMFEKLGSIMVRCEVFNEGLAQIMPHGAKAAKDPVKDAANSVNQVANIIEILNNRRIGIKNKVKGMSNESKKSESNRKPCDITKPLHNEE